MESLNDIIGKTLPERPRRSAYPTGEAGPHGPARREIVPASNIQEQRASRSPGQPASADGPLSLSHHRRLQEQMARLGQKYAPAESLQRREQPASPLYPTHGASSVRMRPARSEDQRRSTYTAPSASTPTPTRPLYPRQPQHYQSAEQVREHGREQVRRQDEYERMPMHAPGASSQVVPGEYHEASRLYRTDEYMPPPQADVLNELDADDEENGMGYGDWEGEDGPVVYQEADVEVLPDSRNQYLALRASQVSPAPSASSVPPMQPAPLSLAQETRHFQRMTQPLHPRAAQLPGRERFPAPAAMPQSVAVEASHVSHTTRQLTPREPATPVQATPHSIPVRNTSGVRGVCPLCKGAGFLRSNVPFGNPNFGKPIPCECKEAEKREKRRQQLLEISDISAFRSRNFNNFNTHFPGIHPSVQEAYQAAYAFAQSPDGWLVLVGPNGCGKTHLAAAIANQCLAQGEVVLFSVVPELLDHLRAAFAPSSTEIYDQLFSKMREASLLILDDLGAHYTTPWATEKLFQLLNYRYNWRMPTVITCNMSGLQTIDVRLRSRMADSSLALMINLERARDCRPYLVRQEP